jgi:hypothetical protein
MSYQRAVVNCRRCYELGSNQGISSRPVDSDLAKARNDAMQALEEEISRVRTLKDCSRVKNADTALNACMHCDYKTPRIAEIFDPSDGSV